MFLHQKVINDQTMSHFENYSKQHHYWKNCIGSLKITKAQQAVDQIKISIKSLKFNLKTIHIDKLYFNEILFFAKF